MGKYMRKTKASGEVAVMELGGALLGVRTRSRTLLALQQQQQQQRAPSSDFLELRSRRLEKQPPPPPPPHKDKDKDKDAAAGAGRKEQQASAFADDDDDLEASFGDNALDWDWDAIERSTRETTPCSLIRSSETMGTPGSATRTTNRRTPVCRYIPSSLEMEEFFDAAERQQHQAFREKYNFCPESDCPLPGRYEWARIDC